MKNFFFSEDNNFYPQLRDFLDGRANDNDAIVSIVTNIINDVKIYGDSALEKYTKKFDRFDLKKNGFFYRDAELKESIKKCSLEDKKAVDLATDRIISYHEKQVPKNIFWRDKLGVELGWVWKPVERVGVYVPGGTASYPSSAIMNIAPAKVAGVNDIVLTSPVPGGNYNPLMIYAANSMNINQILRLGGAQAIAAFAFGTETVRKVNKISGPGNEFVAEAKRQVFGQVGIDSVAGPSEVLLICDSSMPEKIAAIDLLSQAEHDPKAQAILVTDNREYGLKVKTEVERYLSNLKRKEITRSSWESFGAIIIVPNFKRGIEIANLIAPEHLQLCFNESEKYLEDIINAGSVFVGYWSPEAMGDYITGSNHVLPTNGTAKFSSSLSVFDFMRRISVTKVKKNGFEKLAPYVKRLADSEGLEAHSLSVSERLKDLD